MTGEDQDGIEVHVHVQHFQHVLVTPESKGEAADSGKPPHQDTAGKRELRPATRRFSPVPPVD
jgi:hypothetical protein